MTDELPIGIRPPASKGERQLIVEASCHARQPPEIPWSPWFAMYSPAVYEAVNTGRVLVGDSGGVVVGFVVVSPIDRERLFMLYVKKDYRGERIGMRLLRAAMPDLISGPVGLEIPVTSDLVTPSFKHWCRRHGMEYELPEG